MDPTGQAALADVLRRLDELLEQPSARLMGDDEVMLLESARDQIRRVHAAAVERFRAVLRAHRTQGRQEPDV